jgi:hypothetical protein
MGNWEIAFARQGQFPIMLTKDRKFPNFPFPKFPNASNTGNSTLFGHWH